MDPTEDGRKSIKVWSDRMQAYYYKSKDTNYYNDYFRRTKREMQCEICGKTITCQMCSHLKSESCKLKQQEKKSTNYGLNLKILTWLSKFYPLKIF